MATYSLEVFPRVTGLLPGPDMAYTRSWVRTSKMRKDRLPISTPSPIPPSVSDCFGARSTVRCLEAPEITSPCLPFPWSLEEHAEQSKTASRVTRVRNFLVQGPRSTLPAQMPAKREPP